MGCGACDGSTMPTILAFENISKRFGAVVIANGIDLSLAEGEALGIIGPNGAGKTTLFAIASGALRPDAGRVLLAGRDITTLPPERRCRLGIGRSTLYRKLKEFGLEPDMENEPMAKVAEDTADSVSDPLRKTA